MEIKQLKYFVVSADVGSFSEAAKVLFTTQSSVSKVVSSLESELEYPLFKRESRGISLTEKGKSFYQKASHIVLDFDRLESENSNLQKNVVRIGMNHSSWLSNCFSKFYDNHREEDACFYIHADSTMNLIERIRQDDDEIEFIYVFPDSRPQIEYMIKKYNLRFVSLKSMNGMVYLQPEDMVNTNLPQSHSLKGLKFIQSENDEYLRYGKWSTSDGELIDISQDISVVTNSDYVMHYMLEKNHLANLSAASFNNYESGYAPGLELFNEGGQIEFGYLINREYTPGTLALEFLDYVRHAIEE